ncbi:redox-sensitive bicupin YhaK (pirin superfamily)/predicted GNAT family acetyltransferase [Sinomonas atrocyanea]|uniref:bifunctional pirin family protein/GNAT family N-acetyltransferase n=1 Tax=Sinomonas atrocyanea TaxID=37927 RepID=UPI00278222BC|nr:bifunctional pirin family protein/GNAT family N-acetyltransferase [Sinomonas atrocyanea]MDP9884304.1 redox-sensitive bicupin YhaK (pirin superfamily)/predicted GNAT family acetyltransferase [Sinomonas atrocyanea]
MSNLELDPPETLCADEPAVQGIEVIEPRDVPLGGPRAMPVRRTLPSRQRSLVGAWCFLDHYGPDDVSATGGMRVPPHPHTGLQTVSWLFTGEIEHRDSAGHQATVRPGELNLMTAGRGINHSEYSTPQTTTLHGVQLWTALPAPFRSAPPGFERYVPPAVVLRDGSGGRAGELRVFLGSLHGSASPVRTYTALLGAEAVLEPGGEAVLEVAEEFEHAILADGGALEVEDGALAEAHLAFLAPGRGRVRLANPGPRPVRAVILGGPPFPEEITMWWNFVGRSHEEIAAFRDAWNAQLAEQVPADDGAPFGPVVELTGGEAALPAPPLPNVRLRPRPGAPTPDGTSGTVKRGTPMTVQESERQSGKTEFVHADQRHRYEVHVGGVVAGFTQYREKEGGSVYAFDHTEVADGYSGMGLASKLVTYALDDVRSAGRRIRPYCPYVRAFIKRHQDYADLVEDGFVMDED